MRTWLVSYSWSSSTKSGFGNMYRRHENGEPMDEKNIRECENDLSEYHHGTAVILAISELEK